MIQQIELFLLVLGVIFTAKFLVQFVMRLTEDSPAPLEVSKTERVLLYIAIAYIITSIINVIIN